ncbi:hypothetical protein CGG93_19835 [Vibrio parahaemolyticus]|uniref:hypothetical protein n=1 Tax=Vibrio parahaemolyticus TaxID=670 RepID=UPI00111EF99B|nr:hypothetical protein [Vibrio parahaemolyticus]TOQ65515.1 hypothetical protein CGG93_19835 [Vibrio parahaemolyticus]
MPTTTPLSIYLLKKGINANTSVLKLNNANSHNVEIDGTTSKMHVQSPTSNPPAFAKLFTESNQLAEVDFGTNQSTALFWNYIMLDKPSLSPLEKAIPCLKRT